MQSEGMLAGPELPRWGRLAMAATGIAGSGTFLAVNFSNLPLYGDSLQAFARWAPSHHAEADHSIGLLLLTYLLYLVFAVYIATVAGRRGGWSALMARIAVTAVAARFAVEITQLTFLTTASSSLLSASGTARVDFGETLDAFASQLAVTSLIPHMVFLGAVGAAMLASRAVPAWLAWLTLAGAAIHAWAFLAVTTGVPVGPLGLVWYASIIGWPLVTSVTLCLLTAAGRDVRMRPVATAIADPR